MKKFFIICLTMSVSLNATVQAQLKKLTKQQIFDNIPSLTLPVNDVTGWSDNSHYIEVDKARKLFAVDITTGVKTPYTPPPKSNVKVFNKDNDVYIQYGVEEPKKLTINKD
jgi:dipeptidyl-peptidase-4